MAHHDPPPLLFSPKRIHKHNYCDGDARSAMTSKSLAEPVTVSVSRDWDHPQNLACTRETYVPGRLLEGLLPAALVDESSPSSYQFWQDEAKTKCVC